MQNKIFFSICVPVYNVEKYIQECIDSILNQSYANFELILVDDGSTDNSFSICLDYERRDSRIRSFTKKNEGQLATRLFAFEKSVGDVLLCVDSDDFIEKNMLEVLNKYFCELQCDLIYFRYQRFFNGRKEIVPKVQKKELLNDKSLIYERIVSNTTYNSMCFKAFRRKTLPQIDYSSFYKLRQGEDLIQTLQIVKKADNVFFCDDVLYNYRMNPTSISHSKLLNPEDAVDNVRGYVYDFLKIENVFEKKQWDKYGTYCAELFFSSILNIAQKKSPFIIKLNTYNAKRNSSYYINFVCYYKTNSIFKNINLKLFQKKYFVLLLFILSIESWAIYLKAKIKTLQNNV